MRERLLRLGSTAEEATDAQTTRSAAAIKELTREIQRLRLALEKLSDKLENYNPPNRWLTMKEACKYSRLSKDKLRYLINTGRIYAHREKGKLIVDRLSIDKYFTQDMVELKSIVSSILKERSKL